MSRPQSYAESHDNHVPAVHLGVLSFSNLLGATGITRSIQRALGWASQDLKVKTHYKTRE